MRTLVKSFTYEPKIQAVLSGECTQTIRKYDPMTDGVQPGDQILFHGWKGKARRSDWSWRKRILVTEVIPLMTDDNTFIIGTAFCRISSEIEIFQNPGRFLWDSKEADQIAELDHIDPPKGTALRDLLRSLNPDHSYFQIIRWKPSVQCELLTTY